MPPKKRSKKDVAQMRRRFREAIDWGFDGNLSMTARVLKMSLSTVQQYYVEGPRRVSQQAVQKLGT